MIGSCTFTRGPCRAEPRNHAEMRSQRQPRHCSHVSRPPSAHMGARQLILRAVKDPHNSNENQHSSSEGPSLPCAVPASARARSLHPRQVAARPVRAPGPSRARGARQRPGGQLARGLGSQSGGRRGPPRSQGRRHLPGRARSTLPHRTRVLPVAAIYGAKPRLTPVFISGWPGRCSAFSRGARTPRLRASAGRVQADRAAARTTGGGDTRAMRERDTQCCWDRADLMTGTTRLQVMIPDDDSFQSACLRRCWSVRGSAVCRCWAACVRRGASCRAWTSGGGCARGVRQRGRAGTVQPASRLASDCLRTADGPGSPLPDVNVVLTPGNP